MTKTIEMLFDFVSPNGYLAWYPLHQIARKHGATIIVTPVLLGGMHKLTGNAPPMIRDAQIKGKSAYEMLEMNRFIIRHGFTRFTMNPHFPFSTVMLQRLLLAAQEQGRDSEFIEYVLPLVWEQGFDGANVEAVAAMLEASPFDGRAMLERIGTDTIKQRLIDNTSAAVSRGAFGIPTFFVGEEMFFGKERLGQIEELLAG